MTASGPLRAAVACPQTIHRPQPIEPGLTAFAVRAEQLGLAGIWTCELTTASLIDPLLLLSYCAATTERIGLGVAVLLTSLRNPLRLAQETATLDRLSGGRLTVGVGLGGRRSLYPKYGLEPTKRADRFEVGLEVLIHLWERAGRPPVNDYWELDGSELLPPPVQKPHPPLWFGARSDAGLERAVRLGDGFVGSGSEPTGIFAEHVRVLTRLRGQKDQTREFEIAKRLYLVIDDDRGRALARAREWFGTNYGRAELADEVVAIGTAGECAAAAADVFAAGAGTVIFNPIVDERDQLERLVAEVIPAMPPDLRPVLGEQGKDLEATDWPSLT